MGLTYIAIDFINSTYEILQYPLESPPPPSYTAATTTANIISGTG